MKIINISPDEQLAEIKRNISELLPEDDFYKKLVKSYNEQKPLKIKFGADPSRPDIHLGHSVVLNKLKSLQDFGHEIIFLIGDYTAQIGDPSGKNKTRPILTDDEVLKNAQTYQDQVGKILDLKKTKVVFNKDWLAKFTGLGLIELMSKATIGMLIEREDFKNRYQSQEPIYLHEFVYPLLQGYDSVHLKSDLELGGTDQTFNLMMGRHLQKIYQQAPQCILTMPILEGLDGHQKMSKSLDNYIGIDESSESMFGKMMSISDELMKKYYQLLTQKNRVEISQILADLSEGRLHPMIAKKNLAQEITSYFHGLDQAVEERNRFESRFSKKEIPDDLPVVLISGKSEISLLDLMMEHQLIKSRSDGRRLLSQKAVKIDGEAFLEDKFQMKDRLEVILKVGKLKMIKLKAQ